MYNLSTIMLKAWSLYRTKGIDFSEALHRAWLCAKAVPVNAERIEKAKKGSEIREEIDTWSGWKARGYEVIHGSKGDGAVYNARFFGKSQVRAVA